MGRVLPYITPAPRGPFLFLLRLCFIPELFFPGLSRALAHRSIPMLVI